MTRRLLLALFGLYFLLPLLATAIYSLWAGGQRYDLSAYARILGDPQFRSSFTLSFTLAVETVVLSLLLLIPAVFWANLRWPGLRALLEVVSVMPFVVPPIALVGGADGTVQRPSVVDRQSAVFDCGIHCAGLALYLPCSRRGDACDRSQNPERSRS